MLAAGNFPRHRTIRDFRALHLKELSDCSCRWSLAREMGLVKLGTVAIDGTKVKANASRHKAMSYERMKQGRGRTQGADRRAAGARQGHRRGRGQRAGVWTCPAEIERREGGCGHPRSP
jgi:hypothetical protein